MIGPATRSRFIRSVVGLTLALLGALALAVRLGVEPIDWRAVLEPGTVDRVIVIDARLARALLGATVGAALASAGVTFQTLVRNPLADPYVLGVSQGASIGAVLAMLSGHGTPLALSLGAFAGAIGALVLVYRLGRVRGELVPGVALLAGVVFNACAWAFILTVAMLARGNTTAEMLLWLLGSLSSVAWQSLAFAGVATLGGIAVLVLLSPGMNALVLGDEGAHSLGVDVPRLRKRLFVIASLLTAVSVSLAGPIGFVGLIVPHLVRLVLGSDHRLLVPASAVFGALFLSTCDLLTRLAFLALGTEPPVGVLTALLGGPFFLALLWRRRGERLF